MRKLKRTVGLCLACAVAFGTIAQAEERDAGRGATVPRILIVGDSWAEQIGGFGIFETVLANEGLSNVGVIKIGIGGTTAAQWASDLGKLATITTELTDNPTIDIVHINLGGNDYLAAAGSIVTEQDLIDVLEAIGTDIAVVVDHIHSINPNIRIALGSYDYLANLAFNPVLITGVPISVAGAQTRDRFEFINAIGYTHYALGYPGVFGPGETPIPGGFPEYDPAGGGDPTLGTHSDHNDGGIHLVPVSYIAYIERCFNEFYRAWLLEDAGGATIWIDFAHRGDERGTESVPMNDLTNAVTMVNPGGTLKIKGDTSDSSTPETLTLSKAMRIEAVNGTVSIGGPGQVREGKRRDPASGFVSKVSTSGRLRE